MSALFVRRILGIAAVVMLGGATVAAQDVSPSANAFRRAEIYWGSLSYEYQTDTNLYGGELALTINANRNVGVVASLTVHETDYIFPGVRQDVYTYRFGPKFTGRAGARMSYFAQALAGGARVQSVAVLNNGSTLSSSFDDGFSFHAGGGFDVGIVPWMGLRFARQCRHRSEEHTSELQ